MGQGTYRVMVWWERGGGDGTWVCAADGFLDRDNAVEFGRANTLGSEWEVEWVHPAEG